MCDLFNYFNFYHKRIILVFFVICTIFKQNCGWNYGDVHQKQLFLWCNSWLLKWLWDEWECGDVYFPALNLWIILFLVSSNSGICLVCFALGFMLVCYGVVAFYISYGMSWLCNGTLFWIVWELRWSEYSHLSGSSCNFSLYWLGLKLAQ